MPQGLKYFESDDLGAGGCCITVDQPMAKGTRVSVSLASSQSNTEPQGGATVAWSSQASPYRVGLAFSDALAEQVIVFIHDLLGPVQLRADDK
jgi:PilZ domain